MQRRRRITKSTDPSPEQILCQILLVDLLVVTLVGRDEHFYIGPADLPSTWALIVHSRTLLHPKHTTSVTVVALRKWRPYLRTAAGPLAFLCTCVCVCVCVCVLERIWHDDFHLVRVFDLRVFVMSSLQRSNLLSIPDPDPFVQCKFVCVCVCVSE